MLLFVFVARWSERRFCLLTVLFVRFLLLLWLVLFVYCINDYIVIREVWPPFRVCSAPLVQWCDILLDSYASRLIHQVTVCALDVHTDLQHKINMPLPFCTIDDAVVVLFPANDSTLHSSLTHLMSYLYILWVKLVTNVVSPKFRNRKLFLRNASLSN